ncbi:MULTISPECIES: hypothetical protein [unclassified Variovorax]|uniref:hypothetical protein n=1 Tax=unclassified Variovorax TaxID=663243 RepID=UPI001BD2660F|nr:MULTISPECIES: hypothetical protein [unclassified Variovorax]
MGTWLSESDDEGIRTRTVIALAEAGEFDEVEKIDDGKGTARETRTGGEWSFDGTNFKRKYTRKDGQPLPMNYFATTTYAINMIGDDRFFGVDNLRHRTVSFARAHGSVRPKHSRSSP